MLTELTDVEKAAELQIVHHEALRLRDCAKRADADMLAFLLENVVHECRAEMATRGIEPEKPVPDGGNVLKFR